MLPEAFLSLVGSLMLVKRFVRFAFSRKAKRANLPWFPTIRVIALLVRSLVFDSAWFLQKGQTATNFLLLATQIQCGRESPLLRFLLLVLPLALVATPLRYALALPSHLHLASRFSNGKKFRPSKTGCLRLYLLNKRE